MYLAILWSVEMDFQSAHWFILKVVLNHNQRPHIHSPFRKCVYAFSFNFFLRTFPTMIYCWNGMQENMEKIDNFFLVKRNNFIWFYHVSEKNVLTHTNRLYCCVWRILHEPPSPLFFYKRYFILNFWLTTYNYITVYRIAAFVNFNNILSIWIYKRFFYYHSVETDRVK